MKAIAIILDSNPNLWRVMKKCTIFIKTYLNSTGWIDISNLLAKVPIINNNIYVKILSMPHDNCGKTFTHAKLKAIGIIDPFGDKNNSVKSTESVIKKQKQHQVKNGYHPDLVAKKISVKQKNDVNLVDIAKNDESLLDGQKKKEFKEQTTQDKLNTFKDSFNQEQLKKQNQRTAAIQLDEKITQWGYCGKKTLNNVATLLITLHTLWPAWKPISLADLLKPEDIQSNFKKAKFMVHPDKNRNKDPKTQYLAKRLFQVLNDAKAAQK